MNRTLSNSESRLQMTESDRFAMFDHSPESFDLFDLDAEMAQLHPKHFSSMDDDENMSGSEEESYSESDGRRSGSKSGSRPLLDKNSEEYKRRREKNNEAVRRSREKAKIKYTLTEERIQKLRAEKKELETRVNGMKKELNVLQELAKTFGINPEAGGVETSPNKMEEVAHQLSANIKVESSNNFGYM